MIQGLSKAQRFASELARDDNTVEAVIEYINKIENFKHEEDEGSAASQLQELHLSLEHVPGHFLKSTNVNYRIDSAPYQILFRSQSSHERNDSNIRSIVR